MKQYEPAEDVRSSAGFFNLMVSLSNHSRPAGWVIHALVIPLILLLSASVAFCGESGGGKWSFSPFTSIGMVQEYIGGPSFYAGGGILAVYDSPAFKGKFLYRRDQYRITYFGVPKDAVTDFFGDQTIYGGRLFFSNNVYETKDDFSVLLGGKSFPGGFKLFAGARMVQLKNVFSSMDIIGPSVGVEKRFKFMGRDTALSISGAANIAGGVKDRRSDYARFEGAKTISYFGEARYVLDWSLLVLLAKLRHFNLYAGYDGYVISFKHVGRVFTGLALQAEF